MELSKLISVLHRVAAVFVVFTLCVNAPAHANNGPDCPPPGSRDSARDLLSGVQDIAAVANSSSYAGDDTALDWGAIAWAAGRGLVVGGAITAGVVAFGVPTAALLVVAAPLAIYGAVSTYLNWDTLTTQQLAEMGAEFLGGSVGGGLAGLARGPLSRLPVPRFGGRSAGRAASDAAAGARAARAPVPSTAPRDPRLFRRTSQSRLDENYYRNAVESGEFFDDFIDGAGRISGDELARATDRMHEIAALGRRGNRPYEVRGPDGRLSYRTDQINAGRYWERNQFDIASNRPNATRYTDALMERFGIRNDGVRVNGVSDAAQPVNLGGRHMYPGSREAAEYYAEAARALNQFRSLPNGSTGPTRAQLNALADYYHALVNARPYEQINNSMYMTQVNNLLRRAGHPGVEHGYIDHIAHRSSSEAFREIFARHVAGELPTPGELGLPNP